MLSPSPDSRASVSFDSQRVNIDFNKYPSIKKCIEESNRGSLSHGSYAISSAAMSKEDLKELKREFQLLLKDIEQSKRQFQEIMAPVRLFIDRKLSESTFNSVPQRSSQLVTPITGIHGSKRGNTHQNKNSPPKHKPSVKPVERIVSSSGSNHPNDVWVLSDPFFKPIKSNDEIMAFFRSLQAPFDTSPLTPTVHWSYRFAKIAQEVPKDGRRSYQALPPPEHKHVTPGLSEYWAKNPPTFPIEDIQKRSKSALLNILSALVEVTDSPTLAREDRDPLDHQFLKSHPPLPSVKQGGYTTIDFETRLGLELAYLSLNIADSTSEKSELPFIEEIQQWKRRIDTVIKTDIQNFYNEIMERCDEIRADQKSREEGLLAYITHSAGHDGIAKRKRR